MTHLDGNGSEGYGGFEARQAAEVVASHRPAMEVGFMGTPEEEGRQAEEHGVAARPKTTLKHSSLLETFEQGISLRSLLRGFPAYLHTWGQILKRRGAFIEEQSSTGKACWKDPAWFLLFSIFVSFVLLIPTASITGFAMGKWSYMISLALTYTVYGVLDYVGVKIVGGRGSLAQTLCVSFYIYGMFLIVQDILLYPFLLFVAFPGLGAGALLAYLILMIIVIAIVPAIIYNCWMARVHRIRSYRVGFANLIIAPVLVPVVSVVLPVLTGFIGNWFEKIMSHL